MRKNTFDKILCKQSSKTLTKWMKILGLKSAQTPELQKQAISEHLAAAAESQHKLPPKIIEALTNKVNDIAVCEELDMLGISRSYNAKSRKKQLQIYLTDNFTLVNMKDRLQDFKTEKSSLKVSINKSLRWAKETKRKSISKPNKTKRRAQIAKSTDALIDTTTMAKTDRSYEPRPLQQMSQERESVDEPQSRLHGKK